MKTSTRQLGNFRPAISRIVMAIANASLIGGMCMTTALARDNDDRQGQRDDSRQKDRQDDRDRRESQPVYQPDYRPAYQPFYQERYYYSQPVYPPPPVYYAPEPSPGINLFFPLDIRIR